MKNIEMIKLNTVAILAFITSKISIFDEVSSLKEMKRIVVLVLVSFSLNALCQESWPPIGAFWNYKGDSIAFNGNSVDAELTIYVIDSIEINGFTHKLTRQVGHEYIMDKNNNMVVSRIWDDQVCCLLNRNDSIFQVEPQFQIEQFLYDFNAQKGDSMTVNQNIPYTVDSISYVIHSGDTLKKTNYRKDCQDGTLGSYILEGVGPLSIEDTIHKDSVCNTGSGNSYQWHFTCYSDQIISYPYQCDALKTNVKNIPLRKQRTMISIEQDRLLIHPVNFSNETSLKVYNMSGQEVISKKFFIEEDQKIINLNTLKNGVYIVRLIFDDNHVASKMFVLNH